MWAKMDSVKAAYGLADDAALHRWLVDQLNKGFLMITPAGARMARNSAIRPGTDWLGMLVIVCAI